MGHTHSDNRPTFGCPACIVDRDLGSQFPEATFLDASTDAQCDIEDCKRRAVIACSSEEFAVDVYLCRECASTGVIYNEDGEVLR